MRWLSVVAMATGLTQDEEKLMKTMTPIMTQVTKKLIEKKKASLAAEFAAVRAAMMLWVSGIAIRVHIIRLPYNYHQLGHLDAAVVLYRFLQCLQEWPT